MSVQNIMLSTDRNYIPQLNTLLHSLFCNNQECKFHIHVLHSSLDEADISIIEKLVRNYDGSLFTYKIAPNNNSETMAKKTRLPMETYYRLLCMDHLPESIDKVLYLDCDIIINGSLKPLFDIDLTRYLFAAADDYVEVIGKNSEPTTQQRAVIDQYLPSTIRYVNAGVLLISLESLRKVITTEEIINKIEEYGNVLVWHDQDFINYNFYEHILHLNYTLYNYFPVYWYWEELNHGKPVIIHFGGVFKPWKEDYFNRCEPFAIAYQGKTRPFIRQAKELYEKYAKM